MNENQEEAAGQPVPNMWPWFMGVPWAPKFDGKKEKFADWASQIKALLRAQGLNEEQKIDFVINSIEGDAKREIFLEDEQQRDTADKIIDILRRLYGDTRSAADLRTAFFNIKQGNGETVSDFSLRIREAFQEWKRAEPNGSAQFANTLRDQMIISLQPGVLKKELQRQVRRNADLTITELLQEAKELEREGWGMECEGLSNQVATTPIIDPLSQWKDQTRTELLQLITELGKGLKEEIQNLRQATPHSRAPSQRRPHLRPRWDDQGRPICLHCGQAGHFRRECPQGQAPQPALNSQPRPL